MAPDPQPAPAWRKLQLSRRTKHKPPPLFYKLITQAATSSTSSPHLVLHCTDLAVVYTATLTRADILAEATRQHSPIDPSESSKQLHVLLDYLSQSLAGKDNVLSRAHRTGNNDDDDTSLTLRTAIALPRPLRPLTFDFGLARQPPEAFSLVVLRPALEATHVAHRKLAALADVVADKDHVIARLLDYVGSQASGDMSLVFPTLTGRRGRAGEKVGVEEAARHVPGLQQFDLRAWERVQGFGQLEGEGGAEGLVLEGLLEKGEENYGDWVEQLPGPEVLEESGNAGGRLSRHVTSETTKGSLGEDDDDDDDDDDDATESDYEFERQPTPPSARKTAQRKTSPHPSAVAPEQSGEISASSGQDDGPRPSKKQKTSSVGTKRAGKLGGLGRNRRAASKPTQESSPERDTASPPAVDDKRRPSTTSTATATDSEAEAPQPRTTRPSKKQQHHEHSNPTSPIQPQPTDSSQLGALGGSSERNTSPTTPPTASPSPEPEPAQPESSAGKPRPSTPVKKGGRSSKTRTRTPSVEPPDARQQPQQQQQQQQEQASLSSASRSPSPARSPAAAAAAAAEENNDSAAPHRLGKLGLRRKKAGTVARLGDGGISGAPPAAAAESEHWEVLEGLDAPRPPTDGGLGGAEQGSGAETGAAAGAAPSGRDGQQHKKGAMDHNNHNNSNKETEEEEEAGAAAETETETVEQAAARRRQELKRKAAAVPARKKRRF